MASRESARSGKKIDEISDTVVQCDEVSLTVKKHKQQHALVKHVVHGVADGKKKGCNNGGGRGGRGCSRSMWRKTKLLAVDDGMWRTTSNTPLAVGIVVPSKDTKQNGPFIAMSTMRPYL